MKTKHVPHNKKAGEQTQHQIDRLARKAELARASRRRKKLYVQDLEEKVKSMGKKIEELQQKQARSKAQRGDGWSSDDRARRDNQKSIRNRLIELLQKPESDRTAEKELQVLVKRFVENSRERQAQVDFYLDRVADCISPGLQVKFALWGLDQKDEFYEQPGLWSTLLAKEVGLTPEQMEKLKAQRLAVVSTRMQLMECENMVKQMRETVGSHLHRLNNQMDEVENIMTPRQLAKYCMWVEQNEWCMQMLDKLATPLGKRKKME